MTPASGFVVYRLLMARVRLDQLVRRRRAQVIATQLAELRQRLP